MLISSVNQSGNRIGPTLECSDRQQASTGAAGHSGGCHGDRRPAQLPWRRDTHAGGHGCGCR